MVAMARLAQGCILHPQPKAVPANIVRFMACVAYDFAASGRRQSWGRCRRLLDPQRVVGVRLVARATNAVGLADRRIASDVAHLTNLLAVISMRVLDSGDSSSIQGSKDPVAPPRNPKTSQCCHRCRCRKHDRSCATTVHTATPGPATSTAATWTAATSVATASFARAGSDTFAASASCSASMAAIACLTWSGISP